MVVDQEQQVLDVVTLRPPVEQLHHQREQRQEQEHGARQVVNHFRHQRRRIVAACGAQKLRMRLAFRRPCATGFRAANGAQNFVEEIDLHADVAGPRGPFALLRSPGRAWRKASAASCALLVQSVLARRRHLIG